MHHHLINTPFLVFVTTAIAMSLAAWFGVSYLKQRWTPEKSSDENFRLVLGATLTLLGLIIGFSFAMAASRYNQRKDCEEAETNAIATEYLRADLLSAADSDRVRSVLLAYLRARVLFYSTEDATALPNIRTETDTAEMALWATVARAANERRDAVSGQVVAGLNDVLNARGLTTAAWENRIPFEAWGLMFLIALACNIMLGYKAEKGSALLVVLPVVVAIAFTLIADMESPRSGIIRVAPHNLTSLLQSLVPH